MSSSSFEKSKTNILFLAAWFGVIAGLVEGILFLVFQNLGWQILKMSVTPEILWISPLFNLLLFGLAGLGLIAIAFLFPERLIDRLGVFLFAFLAILDWILLALTDRLHIIALFLISIGLAVQIVRWFIRHEKTLLLFWRKSLPWLLGTLLFVFLVVQGGSWLQERIAIRNLELTSPGVPNILVIVVDTLRADHLSSYGYPRTTSPHIDQIAEEGVLFENAFATSAYTLPSHASLLTGRFTFEHGVEWDTPTAFFDSPYPSLAEVLQDQGYRTAAFSANIFWFTSTLGFDRGFIHFEDYFHSNLDRALRTLYGRVIERVLLRNLGFEDIPARKLASDINASFLRWVASDQDRPFFAFLNYMDTHDPYLPPQPYRSKFTTAQGPGGVLNCRVKRCNPKLTSEQIQDEIDAYDGAIAYVDAQINWLFVQLEDRGLDENLLVVITSDHGEAFGEHGMFLHDNSLYKEVIHVPLIFWWPGHTPSGDRVSQPVTIAAIPATLLDLIGENPQSEFPGPSLTALWMHPDDNADWPHPLAEMAHKPWAPEQFPVSMGSMESLITPRWHYIHTENLGAEIFDWTNDPDETNNIAEDASVQSVILDLELYINQQVSSIAR